jgi:hypothetical protein
VLDRNLKVVLPFRYDDVEIDGTSFLAKSNNKINVFDVNGTNLTQNKYDDIYGGYNSGLLLVRKATKEPNGNTDSKYYFVDKQNNIRINLGAKGWQDAKPFSEGLALVENSNNEKGYINPAGQLAIPFKFQYAHSFFTTSKLALVQMKDNSYALINKKGSVVKRFDSELYDLDRESADRKTRIKFKDRTSYNEYGEQVEYTSF